MIFSGAPPGHVVDVSFPPSTLARPEGLFAEIGPNGALASAESRIAEVGTAPGHPDSRHVAASGTSPGLHEAEFGAFLAAVQKTFRGAGAWRDTVSHGGAQSTDEQVIRRLRDDQVSSETDAGQLAGQPTGIIYRLPPRTDRATHAVIHAAASRRPHQGQVPMSVTAPWRLATRVYAAVLVDGGSIMFLTGQAWNHPAITYRIEADPEIDDLPRAVVRRAIQNWNDAIAGSPIRRVRDFRLVRARPEVAADLDIRLLGGGARVDGTTEIVSGGDGATVQAIVGLTWPSAESSGDLGVLGSLALRGIGRALGLGNAADPADPMYPAFNGVKLQPSAPDIAALAAVEEWYVVGSPFFYPPRGYTFA